MRKILLLSVFLLWLSSCAQPATTATPPPLTTAPPAGSTVTPEVASLPWWREAVFYELFVRSFYDSDGNGIGDFNGITAKLGYLQDLGVNAIWLMPINPSPSYHGYDVLNYYAVNPQYGSMQDFKTLLAAAHSRHIRIILDLVLNHTSNQHPWFEDALRGPSSAYRDWYLWSGTPADNHWHPTAGDPSSYYYGYFSDQMPDLNYTNPEVTAQMEDVARFWLTSVSVDGFRIDAAKHLIEEDGKLENTPATHEWYKGFYQVYKAAKPDAYVVGEVYGAGALIDKTYTGDQLDEAFNFDLANGAVNSAGSQTSASIEGAVKASLADMPDGNFATFLTNHDQDRAMSVMKGDAEKAKMAAAILLTEPGVPFIYYGEEIGMTGTKPDEDIRRPMQWSSAPNAGFTTGTPWRAPADDYPNANVVTEESDPGSLLNYYKMLIALRQKHPALATGEAYLLETRDPGVYSLLRVDQGESLLIVINLTDVAVTDYGLDLGQAVLPDGDHPLQGLFGAATQANPVHVQNGRFADFQPLPELEAHTAYIFDIK